jgi:hypothetical protein
MRNTINLAAKVLMGLIILFAVILTAILLAKSDSSMAKDFIKAFNEIGITLNIFVIGTYVITGLTVLLVLGFSIMNMIVKPKAAINALIGIGAMAAIILISFALSSPDIDPLFVRNISENVEVTPALSKQVGAGLIATYILAGLTVLAVIYASVHKLIKG